MSLANSQRQPLQQYDERNSHDADRQEMMMRVIQAASVASAADRSHLPGLAEDSRPSLIKRLLNPEARRHEEVMELIDDTGIETIHGIGTAAAISTDYLANSMDTEAAMEAIILQYHDSAMAMAAAPGYAQLARGMMTRHMTGIAEAGIRRIERKIETR